jgi:hypothetical protein
MNLKPSKIPHRRKENIHAELVRGTEALAAATLLYENGYIGDAISPNEETICQDGSMIG